MIIITKKTIYVHNPSIYLKILARLILLKSEIIDLNQLKKEDIDEILFFCNKVLSFENFENNRYIDTFIFVKDLIEYLLSEYNSKINNFTIVKNLIYLGCNISNMNITIKSNTNYSFKFLGDPSNDVEYMIINKKIKFSDFYNLQPLNKNNISPEIYTLWDNFWMNKSIKDFRDKDLEPIIWKDFIENKNNLSYKELYKFLEEHILYQPGGKGYKEALIDFNNLNY